MNIRLGTHLLRHKKKKEILRRNGIQHKLFFYFYWKLIFEKGKSSFRITHAKSYLPCFRFIIDKSKGALTKNIIRHFLLFAFMCVYVGVIYNSMNGWRAKARFSPKVIEDCLSSSLPASHTKLICLLVRMNCDSMRQPSTACKFNIVIPLNLTLP